MSSHCGQAVYSPDWQETLTMVTAMVGSKKRMIELNSNFINGSFQIHKQQSEEVKKGQENVATLGPNPKASKNSSASKTGKKKKCHVPLADVNGSNENQENGESNTTKKSKTGRKEKTQVVQESTGTI